MSLLPVILRDILRPLRALENQMRLTEELFHPTLYRLNNRPRYIFDNEDESFKRDAVIQDKEKLQLKLDVQDFKPDEITVKTVNGNAIQIEAKHEESHDDKGFISRHLIKKFVLPKGHDIKNVASSLSSDGVLTITAPRNVEELQEKVIPVIHEGTAEEKENPKEGK